MVSTEGDVMDRKIRAKQKAKENSVQRNAHNMKTAGGVRLFTRDDRLEEIKRRNK